MVMPEAVTLRVYAGLSGDHLCNVTVHLNSKAQELRQILEGTTGIPELQQQLVIAGNSVGRDERLADILNGFCEHNAEVVLLLRADPAWAAEVDSLRSGRLLLRHARAALRDNVTAVLAAVAHDGLSLQYAADSLQGDGRVVLAALMRDVNALKYANPKLLASRDFMLTAVSRDYRALAFTTPLIRADVEVVSAAVSRNTHALTLVDRGA